VLDAAAKEHDVVSLGAGAHGTSVKIRSSALIHALNAFVADVTKVDGRRIAPDG